MTWWLDFFSELAYQLTFRHWYSYVIFGCFILMGFRERLRLWYLRNT